MVLRALIDDRDDPDLKAASRKLLQKHGTLEVCHVSIGEAFATMAEDTDRTPSDCADAGRAFHLMVKTGSISICGLHNHKETHRLALRLHERDQMLEPNDGIILANALLCKECDSFFTRDPQMLVSSEVETVAGEYSKSIKSPEVLDTYKNRRRHYS